MADKSKKLPPASTVPDQSLLIQNMSNVAPPSQMPPKFFIPQAAALFQPSEITENTVHQTSNNPQFDQQQSDNVTSNFQKINQEYSQQQPVMYQANQQFQQQPQMHSNEVKNHQAAPQIYQQQQQAYQQNYTDNTMNYSNTEHFNEFLATPCCAGEVYWNKVKCIE